MTLIVWRNSVDGLRVKNNDAIPNRYKDEEIIRIILYSADIGVSNHDTTLASVCIISKNGTKDIGKNTTLVFE